MFLGDPYCARCGSAQKFEPSTALKTKNKTKTHELLAAAAAADQFCQVQHNVGCAKSALALNDKVRKICLAHCIGHYIITR